MNHLVTASNLAEYNARPSPILHSAPLTADACYTAAQVAAEQGRHEDACDWLNKGGELETEAVNHYCNTCEQVATKQFGTICFCDGCYARFIDRPNIDANPELAYAASEMDAPCSECGARPAQAYGLSYYCASHYDVPEFDGESSDPDDQWTCPACDKYHHIQQCPDIRTRLFAT